VKRWHRLKTLRVEVVHPKPGDVLIVSTEQPLTREEFAEAREHLHAFFPGNEALFMPPGWNLDTAQAREGDAS
jgi:hypothetical protein